MAVRGCPRCGRKLRNGRCPDDDCAARGDAVGAQAPSLSFRDAPPATGGPLSWRAEHAAPGGPVPAELNGFKTAQLFQSPPMEPAGPPGTGPQSPDPAAPGIPPYLSPAYAGSVYEASPYRPAGNFPAPPAPPYQPPYHPQGPGWPPAGGGGPQMPGWPPNLPRRSPEQQRRDKRIGFILGTVALVLIIGLVSVLTFNHGSLSFKAAPKASPQPTFPASWDARVLPEVGFVQQDRGLTFKHPVAVSFLSDADYVKQMQSSGDNSGPNLDAQETGLFRAVGLIQGSADLNDASNKLADDGTAAFYDSTTKQVYVRGTDLTLDVKVTLVHELTHAVQDQYFDLSRGDSMINSGAQEGFQALVEGDAVRVQNDYVDTLPSTDQALYEQQDQAASDAAQQSLTSVPPAMLELFGAPYELGPELLKVLVNENGNASVDSAFRNPPSTELQYFDPWVFVAQTPAAHVDQPAAPKGTKKFDNGDFGAMSWYVVLTQRIAPAVALPAADAWAGDAYVGYTENGKSCMAATVAATPTGLPAMTTAFTQWAQAMPAGSVTVTPDPAGIKVTACDPGTAAGVAPVATAQDALVVPVTRTEFTIGVLAGGAPQAFARCSGTKVAEGFSEQQLEDPSYFTSRAGLTKVAQVVAPCRSAAGLS
ncbi:MAG TPA: hypothetical protein VFW71_14450 [Actinomycetota bacterium]|nr:hypothetical protein [Actinomycetota bacterium]